MWLLLCTKEDTGRCRAYCVWLCVSRRGTGGVVCVAGWDRRVRMGECQWAGMRRAADIGMSGVLVRLHAQGSLQMPVPVHTHKGSGVLS